MKTVGMSIFLLICVSVAIVHGENGNNIELPETIKGKRVVEFFNVFNADDDKPLADFLQGNLRSDTNETSSIERRLERMLSFKRIALCIAIEKVLSVAVNRIRVLTRDSGENYFEIMFTFEEEKTGKITAISIIPIEPEDLTELSGPLLSEKQIIGNTKNFLKDAAQKDFFSGVVLIAQDNRILFQQAYGLASREYDAPNQIDTRFNLGSINKIFTRIAIGQLYERGSLSLDDTLGKFLPDYPNQAAVNKVTVSQLLDMTSGIGDFFTAKYFETPKYKIRNLEDYLLLFAEDPLKFEPGTGRIYSNGGYLVLGLIVAKASGMDYFDYVRKNIYEPAGMFSTGHLQADFIAKNVASGYTRNVEEILSRIDGENDQVLYSNIYTRPARGSSAGGGYSTAADLFRFAEALRQGRLLGEIRNEWFKGAIAFAGGAPGINAELDIDLIPGWTVVVLANGDPPMANAIAGRIASWLRRLK